MTATGQYAREGSNFKTYVQGIPELPLAPRVATAHVQDRRLRPCCCRIGWCSKVGSLGQDRVHFPRRVEPLMRPGIRWTNSSRLNRIVIVLFVLTDSFRNNEASLRSGIRPHLPRRLWYPTVNRIEYEVYYARPSHIHSPLLLRLLYAIRDIRRVPQLAMWRENVVATPMLGADEQARHEEVCGITSISLSV